MSPPARGRGLKPNCIRQRTYNQQSPPARGRGLKHFTRGKFGVKVVVAPRAGAWIETVRSHGQKHTYMSPPARGRGLKLIFAVIKPYKMGRPPRGGVD